MGVPKFYRWISERYPCLSEVIKQYQIPEFDNLYLDMNGIIHVCSHPNDDDPHFRISEEQIFADIFHYIDFLFKMIKPKEVFFMAIDGVAPRAKMNQQRGRRFRTARDAECLEHKARENGEILPKEARFDSNCITPGTAFMTRLHEKLKSFVSYKISIDKLWQNVRVYLSGHETPGEGEHKVMDFIRYEKSQPGYNPNTRHCLYGLDADLILLGLSSHEPHFSLLREEVKFGGKKSQKRTMSPEETTFHLLHLSLLREYLEYEFLPAKENLAFDFNVENIIDDFVLMSFLVGNDFIPHLPQLHIQHDALPILFQNYIKVLPTLGGYINEGGFLNLERFELFLAKLAEYDLKKFSETSADFKFLESKHERKNTSDFNIRNQSDNLMVFDKLSELNNGINDLNLVSSQSSLGFVRNLTGSDEDDDDDESLLALEFQQHKRDYYHKKLEYSEVDEEVFREQAEGYVRAIQWNLHYYYNGVVSWSWYYQHHYSPFISDIKNFKNMEMEFKMGTPFLPFQQLLAVLPEASKVLLPTPYQDLMCNEDSALKSFFPPDFETDMNGKQQEWEAVVLIPFISESLLIKCTAQAQELLSEEEKKRNKHGPHLLYTYSDLSQGPCQSFLPKYFPDISENHAKYVEISQDFFRLPAAAIKKGLCEGVQLETFFPGFPTLKHIPHTTKLKQGKVRVFQSVSHRDSMILTLTYSPEQDLKKVADDLVGQTLYVNWPHLQEASVVSISDGSVCYESIEDEKGNLVVKEKHMLRDEKDIWEKQCMSAEEYYYQRLGVCIGEVNILVSAKCFLGSRSTCSEDGTVIESKQWAAVPTYHALQVTIKDIAVHCSEFKKEKPLKQLLPCGSPVFMLGTPYYGSMGEVIDNDFDVYHGRIVVKFSIPTEPDLKSVIKNKSSISSENYMPSHVVAQMMGMRAHFISRLTGTFLVQTNSKESISPNRVNIGLNLKFNRKNEEVYGFSKKTDEGQWLYSEQVLKAMKEYVEKFSEFFQRLNPFLREDVIYLEDLYPDGHGLEVVNKISAWLKSQQCTTAERQSCGMDMVDEGVIKGIQEVVDFASNEKISLKEIQVKPYLLYSPFCSKGCSMPDPNATFHLFDWVINVCSSSSVPLGLRGIIIGIKPAEKDCDFIYEVLFEKEFFGGMTIRCSTKRAYRMPPSALINISHGVRRSKSGNHLPVHGFSGTRIQGGYNNIGSPRGNRNAVLSTNFGEYSNQKYNHNKFASRTCMLERKILDDNSFPSDPYQKKEANLSVKELKPSPNSNVHLKNMVSGFHTSSKIEFVTPKVNPTASGLNKSVQKQQISPQNSKFHDSWSTLLKKPSPELSVKEKSQPLVQKYGQQVSLEELFEGAQKSIASQGKANVPRISAVKHQTSQPSKPSTHCADSSNVAELMEYCLEHFHEAPQYIYRYPSSSATSSSELESTVISSVKLPNGRLFESASSNKLDASELAASKALSVLKCNPGISPVSNEQEQQSNWQTTHPPDSIEVSELTDFCVKMFKRAPTYSCTRLPAHSIGYLPNSVSIFRLPDGHSFQETSSNELDASKQAASLALQSLKGRYPIYGTQFFFQSPCSQPVQQRFCPLKLDFPRHDIPILRHPQPPSVVHIPNSFVSHNKQYLRGQSMNFPFQHHNNYPIKSPVPDLTSLVGQCSYREVNKEISGFKDSAGIKCQDSSDSNIFVPLQVTKQTTKKPKDSDHPIEFEKEWPSLPSQTFVRSSASKQEPNDHSVKKIDPEDSLLTHYPVNKSEATHQLTSNPLNKTENTTYLTNVPSKKISKCQSKRMRKPKIAAKFTIDPE